MAGVSSVISNEFYKRIQPRNFVHCDNNKFKPKMTINCLLFNTNLYEFARKNLCYKIIVQTNYFIHVFKIRCIYIIFQCYLKKGKLIILIYHETLRFTMKHGTAPHQVSYWFSSNYLLKLSSFAYKITIFFYYAL